MRFSFDDTTIEALLSVLARNPRGGLVCNDELGAWFKSINEYKRNGGGDGEKWNKLYNGLPYQNDRKTGDEKYIYIPRASVSLTGSLQPGPFARALTAEYFENGLAARLLISRPAAVRPYRSYKRISREAHAAYAAVVARLASLRGEPITHQPLRVAFDAAADERYTAWHDDAVDRCYEEPDEGTKAWLAKMRGVALRIAMVHALTESPEAEQIPLDSVEAAIEMTDWFADEAKRVYCAMRAEAGTHDELIALIEKRDGAITPRDLHRTRTSKYRTIDAAERALRALADDGLGTFAVDEREGAGRRATVFRLTIDRPPTAKEQRWADARARFIAEGRIVCDYCGGDGELNPGEPCPPCESSGFRKPRPGEAPAPKPAVGAMTELEA